MYIHNFTYKYIKRIVLHKTHKGYEIAVKYYKLKVVLHLSFNMPVTSFKYENSTKRKTKVIRVRFNASSPSILLK